MTYQNRPDELDDRCLPQYSALDNSLGHNPCRVARYLIDQCDFYEYYALPALDLRKGRQNYPVPDTDQATVCLCSMGVYNLVQACAACQQPGPYNSTLWSDWVSNCTYSMVNSGQIFPTSSPSDTEIPAWATVNSASGSLSVGSVYQRTSTGNSTLLVSAVAAASTSATPSAQTYTEVTIPLPTSDSDPSGDSDRRRDAIAGAVVAVVFVGILFAATIIYFRRRRRRIKAQQCADGVPDLADWDLPAGMSSGRIPRTADKLGSMLERPGGRVISAAVGEDDPREVHGSGRSIATNSISTGVPVMVHRGRSRPGSVSSETGVTTRATSIASEDDSSVFNDEEDSLSPFSDLNRPAPSLLATRDNIHRVPAFDRSYSSFSLTPSSVARSLSADDGRSSLHSRRSRAPSCSSNGATWGRMEAGSDAASIR
ncbi:hypothetical protein RHOSPDRAFT_35425 [Rhodotorula sp. JG-1b]|nr:hypothetical protein RHOSPDRAFT_35425 [Rhodotorula sp. JG-1b]